MSLLRVLLRRDTAAPDPFRALPQSPPRGLRARIHPSGCAIRATRVNHRWQVFGLVGSRFSPSPTDGRFPGRVPSACGRVRSDLPLRGSPGLSPGSLLRCAAARPEPPEQYWSYDHGTDQQHGQGIGVTNPCQPQYVVEETTSARLGFPRQEGRLRKRAAGLWSYSALPWQKQPLWTPSAVVLAAVAAHVSKTSSAARAWTAMASVWRA